MQSTAGRRSLSTAPLGPSARIAAIYVLTGNRPPTMGTVLPQLGQLYFWVLAVQRRDSGVQGNTHGEPPPGCRRPQRSCDRRTPGCDVNVTRPGSNRSSEDCGAAVFGQNPANSGVFSTWGARGRQFKSARPEGP